MSDAPVLVRKSVAQIVTFWRVGSRDWTWADEYADVMNPANEVTQAILARVDSEGIDFHDQVAPVLLGSDGRVWDGHHRICIAIQRGIPYLECEVVEKPHFRIVSMIKNPNYFAQALQRRRQEIRDERTRNR